MTNTAPADRPTDSGSRWIPWVFVAFFGVVVAVNATMIFFAIDSWTGLGDETRNSYQQGLRYNDNLAEQDVQRALGWEVGHGFDRTEPGNAHVWMELEDAYGNRLSRAVVSARIVRPTHSGHDFTVDLPHVGQGRYAADVAFPLAGQWEVRLTAEDSAGTYRLWDRVIVR